MEGGANRCNLGSTRKINISIANSDSGWIDGIAPNSDEMDAERNGWRCLHNDGARYRIWHNKVFGTAYTSNVDNYPPRTMTTTTVSAVSGQKNITVVDGSMFKAGDYVCVLGYFNPSLVESVNGNVVTMAFNLGGTIAVGSVMVRADVAGDTRLLDYCKNNRAPGYTPDYIYYKFNQPKPINEDSDSYYAPLKGNPPLFRPGNNMISVKNGIVLDEAIVPFLTNDNWYQINALNYGGLSSQSNPLRYKSKMINTVKLNGVADATWTIHEAPLVAYGISKAYNSPDNVSLKNSYSVDYEILGTIAPQIGGCEISYSEGLSDGMSALFEIDKSKQNQDIVLDTISDWGKMQVIKDISIIGRAYTLSYSSGVFPSLYQTFLLTPRNLNPSASTKVNFCYIYDVNGAITNVPISDVQIGINSGYKDKVRVVVAYCGTNATLKTNATTYGMAVNFDIVLDSEL